MISKQVLTHIISILNLSEEDKKKFTNILAHSGQDIDAAFFIISSLILLLDEKILNSIVDYSTTEHLIGANWDDGNPIYRKVVDFGALPNNTTKDVAHGITNLDVVVDLKGVARNTIIGNYLPLSYPTGSFRVELLIQGPYVRIVTDSNFQDWTQTNIIIEYTKTT